MGFGGFRDVFSRDIGDSDAESSNMRNNIGPIGYTYHVAFAGRSDEDPLRPPTHTPTDSK